MFQKALAQFNKDIPNWYGWIDRNDGEVYSNIKIVKDGAVMPTEAELNAKIAELELQQQRRYAYPAIGDQLDMMYWDNVNGTTTWKDHIAQVKSDNPKPV